MARFQTRLIWTAVGISSILPSARAAGITYSTCVSPDGMQSCFTEADNFYNQCIISAGTDLDKAAACGCVLDLDTINCALANCWNVVYGCEYQRAVVEYYAYCSTDPVPFFPAPDNAPGGCSCNLGYVALNLSMALEQVGPCSTNGSLTEIDGCECCKQAGAYTALYDICPGVNTTLLEWIGVPDLIQLADPPIDQCASDFAQFNCINDLGYSSIGTFPYLTTSPTTTPTGTYSTTGGSITTPLSGATFTWTDLGIAYTITAVSAGHQNSAVSSASSSRGGTGGSGSTSTASGAGSSSTTKSGAGVPELNAVRLLLVALSSMLLLCV